MDFQWIFTFFYKKINLAFFLKKRKQGLFKKKEYPFFPFFYRKEATFDFLSFHSFHRSSRFVDELYLWLLFWTPLITA